MRAGQRMPVLYADVGGGTRARRNDCTYGLSAPSELQNAEH